MNTCWIAGVKPEKVALMHEVWCEEEVTAVRELVGELMVGFGVVGHTGGHVGWLIGEI